MTTIDLAAVQEWAERFNERVAADRRRGEKLPDAEMCLEAMTTQLGNGILPSAIRAYYSRLEQPSDPDTTRAAAEDVDAQLWLDPDARTAMAREIARVGGSEISFILRRLDSGKFGKPAVSIRGAKYKTFHMIRDAEPGVLMIHNHPTGKLAPSDVDVESFMDLHANVKCPYDVADGVIDNTAQRLFLLRDPRPVEREPVRLNWLQQFNLWVRATLRRDNA